MAKEHARLSVTKCEALSDGVAANAKTSTHSQQVRTISCVHTHACAFHMHMLIYVQLHNTTVASGCTSIQESLQTLADVTVQDTAQQWTEEVKGVTDAIGQFASDQDNLLKKTWCTVEKYASGDLKKDIPTGNACHAMSLHMQNGHAILATDLVLLHLLLFLGITPQRRDFSYTSHLTRTREHEELLEEYRTNVDVKSLPEQPESETELESNSAEVSQISKCLILCSSLIILGSSYFILCSAWI